MGHPMEKMDRRAILKNICLGGAAVLISLKTRTAIGQTSSASPRLQVNISRNHGHEFLITLDELFANGPRSYDISGDSHPHDVMITDEILRSLHEKRVVEVESSFDSGHLHILRLEIM